MHRFVPLERDAYVDDSDDDDDDCEPGSWPVLRSSADESDDERRFGGQFMTRVAGVSGAADGAADSDEFEREMSAELRAGLTEFQLAALAATGSDQAVRPSGGRNSTVGLATRRVHFGAAACLSECEATPAAGDGDSVQCSAQWLTTAGVRAGASRTGDTTNAGTQSSERTAEMVATCKRKCVRLLSGASRVRRFPGGATRPGRAAKLAASAASSSDPLYDPNMDTADQQWVDSRRRSYLTPQSGPAGGCDAASTAAARMGSSDAVLNCPCCMALLCLDCQRHAAYRGQYRAMFVFNCRVCRESPLQYATRVTRRRRRRQTPASERDLPLSAGAVAAGVPCDTYLPVRCNECRTEVAVLDKDDVYHFFNVLSSHA